MQEYLKENFHNHIYKTGYVEFYTIFFLGRGQKEQALGEVWEIYHKFHLETHFFVKPSEGRSNKKTW